MNEAETKEHLKKVFLKFPREEQIEVLKKAYREKGFGAYMALGSILLEAPITAGGIPASVLDDVFQELIKG